MRDWDGMQKTRAILGKLRKHDDRSQQNEKKVMIEFAESYDDTQAGKKPMLRRANSRASECEGC